MNSRILAVISIAVISWVSCQLTLGQEGQRSQSRSPASVEGKDSEASDLNAIRSASQAFVDAFNRADAKAVAMLWAADGDYIDDAGRKFQGRAAIEKDTPIFLANTGAPRSRSSSTPCV